MFIFFLAPQKRQSQSQVPSFFMWAGFTSTSPATSLIVKGRSPYILATSRLKYWLPGLGRTASVSIGLPYLFKEKVTKAL